MPVQAMTGQVGTQIKRKFVSLPFLMLAAESVWKTK
jgi:hypothetical protein